MPADLVFYLIAGLLCFCCFMMITRRQPVSSAVFLVGTLFLVAALFAQLGADFIAAIQVLVYAGAIMVLFLFVIMLLNLEPEQLKGQKLPATEKVVLLLTVVSFIAIGFIVFGGRSPDVQNQFTKEFIDANGGNTFVIGMKLFINYLWPFELASFLILLAIVASIVIAKKDKPKKTEHPGAHDLWSK